MLTFVRSMMEWFGGTISKEDVGENGADGRRDRRRRDDDHDEEALGAFALRFKYVHFYCITVFHMLYADSCHTARHVEFFMSPQALMSTYSSKDEWWLLNV